MAISQDVVRRLTVVATERGLTSLKTNLHETDRAYNQVAASATRAATATEVADRRMQALLRQRDRYVTALNAGGIGGVGRTAAGDAGMFAVGRVLPFVAAAGTAYAAISAVNAVIERGSELLEKYANAQRSVDRSDLVENLKTLTKFQNESISAAQVQRATELGNRLNDARFTIEQFMKVQFDLTKPALLLQGAWVGIVEQIALGITRLNEFKRLNPDQSMIPGGAAGRGIASALPGVGLAVSGFRAFFGSSGGQAPSLEQSIAAARAQLAAAMGVANIGKDGAPIGTTFAARYNAIGYDLSNEPEKKKKEYDQYANAVQRVTDEIAQLEAQMQSSSQGFGRNSEEVLRLKTSNDLLRAAKRANKEETPELTAEIEKLSAEYAKLAIQVRQANDQYANASQRVRDEIEQLELQADWYGKTSEEVVKLKTSHDLLRAAQRAGREDTPELRAEIDQLAASFARANEEARRTAEWRRDIGSLGQDLFRAFTSGGDAIKGATNALANFGAKLASRQLERFFNGEGFGSENLMSGRGALGMLGAGVAGYQSGNPLMGALGGAMAGATFGPWGALAGAAIGGVGGLFGQSAQKKQQQQQMMQEVLRINQQAALIGIDTNTRSGSLQAMEIQQQGELQQLASSGNWWAVIAQQDAHRKQMAALNAEWDKRELEAAEAKRQEELRLAKEAADELLRLAKSYDDRRLAAATDASTLEGQLALFDRQAHREREALAENAALREHYATASVDLEATIAIERLRVQEDFNKRALEETKRAQEQQVAAIGRAALRITDYLVGLRTGVDSPLSPSARLAEAQQAYGTTLGLAQGGNVDALDRITKDAEAFRVAAQAMYGSSAQYQAIFNQINQQLTNLSAIQDSSDPVVRALNNIAARQEQVYFNQIATATDASAALENSTISVLNKIFAVVSGFPAYYTQMITSLGQAAAASAAAAAAAQQSANVAAQEAANKARADQNKFNSAWNARVDNIILGLVDPFPWQPNYMPPPNPSLYGPNVKSPSANSLDKIGPHNGYAMGGVAPPNSLAIYGEHHPAGPFAMRVGREPVTFSPGMPSGANDNSALVAEVRALRALVDRLCRENGQQNAALIREVAQTSQDNKRAIREQSRALDRSTQDASTRSAIARKTGT